jgi:hypothetical protein
VSGCIIEERDGIEREPSWVARQLGVGMRELDAGKSGSISVP